MKEIDKLFTGEIYDPSDIELYKVQIECVKKLLGFNELLPFDFENKKRILKNAFKEFGDNSYIEAPLRCNFGGAHVHIGNNVYVNFNLTLVDDGEIFIGDNTLIGPNVTIATACHPLDPALRMKGLQYNKKVVINKNVWIGANAVILPGVTIGENSVIGAGSVVTKDVPSDSVYVGNPARFLKKINE